MVRKPLEREANHRNKRNFDIFFNLDLKLIVNFDQSINGDVQLGANSGS